MTDTKGESIVETMKKAQLRCEEQNAIMSAQIGQNGLNGEMQMKQIEPPPKQTPVSAQSYQKMTPEQKKLHFPVNRAMRRKQGIR